MYYYCQFYLNDPVNVNTDAVHPLSNRQWIEPERTGRVVLALGRGPDPSLRDRDRLPEDEDDQ